MRDMKDSGVVWIGEIPSNWSLSRLKFSSTYNDESLKESHDPEAEIEYVEIGSVTLERGVEKTEILHFKDAPSRARRIARKNDIIISTVRTYLKAIALIEKDSYIVSTGFCVVRPKECVDSRFLRYFCSSELFTNQVSAHSVGISYPAINASTLTDFHIINPPLAEQCMIADFLDKKCAQVDTLIANVQAQIEKLKAYKQSVIAEVVTKGLDPTIPMKDSYVEWLGEYPSHWSYMPFGYVLKERNEKNNPVVSEERLSLSIELGVTLYAEKTTNLDRFKDDFSQYKLAHSGDLVMNSMNMIVGATGVSPYFGCVSPAYYTFYDETDDHITAKYCEYIFRSKTMLRVLHSLGKGIYSIERGDDRINTCRLKVPKVELKALHIPIPPLDEQRSIVRYLNEKCAQINQLITIKQAKIEKLEQYKRSLIYEYVTGKREVV